MEGPSEIADKSTKNRPEDETITTDEVDDSRQPQSESEHRKILSGDFSSLDLSQVKYGNTPAVGFKIVEASLEGGSVSESDDDDDDVVFEPITDEQLFDWVFSGIPIEHKMVHRKTKKKVDDPMESGIQSDDQKAYENGEYVSPYYYDNNSLFHEKNESSIKRTLGLWLTWLWRPLTSTSNEIRKTKYETVSTNNCQNTNESGKRRKKRYEYSDKELKRELDEEDEDVPKNKQFYVKLRAYLKQLEESEGFDIDVENFPGYIYGMTPFVPVTVSQERFPKDYEIFEDVAKFALDTFNFYQKTMFKVDEVMKVNVSINNYAEYLMTFTAKNTKKGWWRNGDEYAGTVKKTFQAQVLVYLVDKKRPKQLELCRIKPHDSQ